MTTETIFRITFWALVASLWVMRFYFMRQVRPIGKRSEIDRGAVDQEGRGLFILRTLILFFLGAILVLYAYDSPWLSIFSISFPNWLRWAGFVLGVVGLGLWTWTQAVLGKEWSPQLQIGEHQRVVTSGPYALIRHPMYTAMFGEGIAFALVTANWCFVLFAVAMIIGFIVRAPREEKMMLAAFGNEYRDYMHRTGRFFPNHIKITIPAWFVFLLLTGCVNAKFTAAPTTVLPSLAPVAASVLPTATPIITSILPTATLPPVVINPIIGSPSPTLPTNLTRLSGPYLGQIPPGSSPTVFASEMIYGELHTPPVFSADGSQAYWGMQGQFIYMTRLENGFWTRPEKIAFSPSMTDYRDPFLAPSGDRMYFLSKGIIPGSELPEKENIWFVERMGTGWGEPQPLGKEVNSFSLHWQVSVNNNWDLYFTSRNSAGEDIYFSRYLDGQYAIPEKLGDEVNTDDMDETTPFIAPDGNYLIFTRIVDNGNGPIRLYISYADSDGGWTEAVLIEQIRYGLCPLESPDGLYLFFLNSPRSVSWMSTGFIEQLKPGG